MAAKKKWTKVRIDRVVNLRSKGLDWVTIGEKLGETAETVRHQYRIRKKEDRKKDHPYADFTKDSIGEIIKKRRHRDGVFFVSSAQATMTESSPDTEWIIGENVDKDFLTGITKNFCKKNDVELILLPGRAQVRALQDQPNHYDPILKTVEDSFATNYKFNKWLYAVDYEINPQQINPLNGLAAIRGKNNLAESIIVASPKDMLEVTATGNSTDPKLSASSMSICKPQYRDNTIGRKAARHHMVGGQVVTILKDTFLLHQVHANGPDSSFNYMAERYYPDGRVVPERSEWMTLGDPHFGEEDEMSKLAWNATYEQFATLQPRRVFIGDAINGASFSHWLMRDPLERSMLPKHYQTIEAELAHCKDRLEEIWSYMPDDAELVIVDSNHHDFLQKYLRAGHYLKDVQNYGICIDMIKEIREGKDPIRERLDPDGLYTWLKSDDDYWVENNQCGAHGHLGPNGARGNIKNLEKIYGQGMIGHSHTMGIWRGMYQVGHLSSARHGYNRGPSAWTLCNGVGYKYGEKSLLPIINGDWI